MTTTTRTRRAPMPATADARAALDSAQQAAARVVAPAGWVLEEVTR